MSGRRQNRGRHVPSPYASGSHDVGNLFQYIDERGQLVWVQADAGSYPATHQLGQVYEAAPHVSGGARRASNTTSGNEAVPDAHGSAVGDPWAYGRDRRQAASSSSTMADSGGWAYGSGGNQSVSPSSTTANWGSLGSNTQNYPPDGMGTRPVPNPSRISTAGESVDNYNWNMNHFMTTPSASVQVRNRSASGSVPFRDAMGLVDELFPGNPDHGRFGQYPGTVEISTSDTDEGNTGVEDSQNESKGKRKSKDRSKGKSDPRYSKSSKK